jgi:hypothetical protein
VVKENSGLKEESCFFGLTFRFIPSHQTGGVWILYDTFEEGRHSHTHPFFFRSKPAPLPQKPIDKNEVEIIKVVNRHDDNITSQAFEGTGGELIPVREYFSIYKNILSKMSNMDAILQQKATGIIVPPKRSHSGFPYFG